VKFIPQVRAGDFLTDRNLFYLPPITLGLMMSLWTVGWSNSRWQSWAVRILAVIVSLLAFPAIESILEEPSGEWLLRIVFVAFVFLIAVLSSVLGKLSNNIPDMIRWYSFLILGLIGALLPTWAYLSVRPIVSALLGNSVGVGPGVLLNAGGHLIATTVGIVFLIGQLRASR
jgi:hypothetical protein